MSVIQEISVLSERQRQLVNDPLTIEIICDALANDGKSVAEVAQSLGVRPRWLRRWLADDDERMRAYERALAIQIDDRVAETHAELLSAGDDDEGKLAERKLKGTLSVAKFWDRERYGDKLEVKGSGSITVQVMQFGVDGIASEKPLEIDVTPEDGGDE